MYLLTGIRPAHVIRGTATNKEAAGVAGASSNILRWLGAQQRPGLEFSSVNMEIVPRCSTTMVGAATGATAKLTQPKIGYCMVVITHFIKKQTRYHYVDLTTWYSAQE